ncbi:hypothetical protein [Coralloluteibacterium thermophilus]|uniref:Bacterial virulence factor lipase N-terminal domain-containing protein n=1 Tax=Coralloluteibacterium thermophilum TaxID=2707049 RepID=A0ABV9NHJ6_9GAMM
MITRTGLAWAVGCTLALSLSACGGGGGGGGVGTAPPPPPATTSFSVSDVQAGALPGPSATDLAFLGSTDGTLNPPVADPNNFADPAAAVGTLDGFGTVTPVTFALQASADFSSVALGSSVRVFEVETNPAANRAVTRVVRELTAQEMAVGQGIAGAGYVTAALVPTQPLKPSTTYLYVLTDGLRDREGNAASPAQSYFLAKRTSPICSGSTSLDPLVPASNCPTIELLRQLVNAQEAAAASAGVARDGIVLSWTVTTQSTAPVMQTVRANVAPAPVVLAPTGQNSGAVGLPPIADIHAGFIELPYYLVAPTGTPGAENTTPTGPLSGFWRAPPCGTVATCASRFGPTNPSTHLTVFNPRPVQNGTVRVPVIVTVPNAASGQTRPAAGWPLAIFAHGITRNRTDAIALSASMAAAGHAVIAIDQPLHGITPADASLAPFRVSATNPLTAALHAAGVRERTFDVDYVDNATGAAGPDGVVDSSGAHFINLGSLLTSRDNLRQSIADLFVLRASVPNMSLDGGATPAFDDSRVSFVGQSLGGIVGTGFVAYEPDVVRAVLSAPGGGVAQMLNGSETFGPRIRAGVAAAAGVSETSPAFPGILASFLGAAQTVLDAADPINVPAALAAQNAILLHEVVGDGAGELPDQVIPNSVAGAPLSGTEPLVRALGLASITATTQRPEGVRGVVRFVRGEHGSLLSPDSSRVAGADQTYLDVMTEMQQQAATFVGTGGTTVRVQNNAVVRGN